MSSDTMTEPGAVMVIQKKVCLRCGHEWFPRTPNEPRVCPKCKSPYWNKPRTRKVTEKNN